MSRHAIKGGNHTNLCQSAFLGQHYCNEQLQGEYKLTNRERDTLYYLIRYYNQKEIARTLNLSPRTVETYINALKIKFCVNSKRELIDIAIQHGYAAPIQELFDLALKHGMINPL